MRGKVLLFRWSLTGLLLAGLFFGAAGLPVTRVDAAPMAQGLPGDVVISEFRTKGAFGIYDEFIELYNQTSSPVDIGKWEIWASNALGETSYRAAIPASTSLGAGQHYLIANKQPIGGYYGPSDLSYLRDIVDKGGIALILISSDGTRTIIDQVGMSSASAYKEGTPLAPLDERYNISYARNATAGACIDTNNNAADFFVRIPSDPQTFSDPVVLCGNPTPTPPLPAVPPATATSTSSPVPTYTAVFSIRSVIINEVAWMGTIASSGDEWIELYNTSSSHINLSGWKLEALDGTPSIPLEGIICAGCYYLLERGDQNVVDVPGNVYDGGPLSDGGEALRLLDASRHVIDSANGNGGPWPAGRVTSNLSLHGTMDRTSSTKADTDSLWVTNTDSNSWNGHDANGNLIYGTPGDKNKPTPTPPATSIHSPTPTRTPAFLPMWKTVVITEVAWMGTVASSSDEWIELYNTTAAPIDLDGWYLLSLRYNATLDDFVPNLNIPLTGTISVRNVNDPRSGFFLLERDDDNTIRDIPADQIYSGELNNTGEIILLCSDENMEIHHNCKFNEKNQIVDFVNGRLSATGGASPWPAGKASPLYGSMERKNIGDEPSNWYTHTGAEPHYGLDANLNIIKGTPKHSNWAYTVTATPSVTPTPTRTNTPLPKPGPILVINEFLPRPGHDWNNDGQINVYDEFIEVMNAGTVDLNLASYKLDDGLDGGSAPFSLPSKTLKPGEKIVYYASQTGIFLSDSGETVRLLRGSNNAVLDAYTYPIAKSLDVSICRLTDGYGSWLERCFPTPGLPNALIGDEISSKPGRPILSFCFLPDSIPAEFVLAECEDAGLGVWNRSYWDASAGVTEDIWFPEERDKGLVRFE